MGTLSIRPVTFAEIESAPNLPELLAEYAHECGMSEIGTPCMQAELYRSFETAGAMHVVGAYVGINLAGFASVLVHPVPHYGLKAAVTESLFVAKQYRQSGAGLLLIEAAETLAKSLGAVALMISAPAGGQLAKVMPRIGYRHSNQVFIRALS